MAQEKRIILIHGWGGGRKKLLPLAKELTSLGWQVLVLPLPGFDLPPPSTVWGVEDYARWVKKEGERFFARKKFLLFGHSFGGRVAVKLAAGDGRLLSGLILCAPAGFSRPHFLKRWFFWILAKGGKILGKIFPPFLVFRPFLYRVARERDYLRSQGIMKEVFKKVVAEGLKEEAKKIKLPGLIVWGEKDKTTPVEDGFLVKRLIPSAELVVFPKQDHQLPYRQPRQLAQEIERWYQRLN